jgi:hypothetical protein
MGAQQIKICVSLEAFAKKHARQRKPKQTKPKQRKPKQRNPKQKKPKQRKPKQEKPKQEKPKQEKRKQKKPDQEKRKQAGISPTAAKEPPVSSEMKFEISYVKLKKSGLRICTFTFRKNVKDNENLNKDSLN